MRWPQSWRQGSERAKPLQNLTARSMARLAKRAKFDGLPAMVATGRKSGQDFNPAMRDLNAAYWVPAMPRTWCCKEVIGEDCNLMGASGQFHLPGSPRGDP